MQLNDFWVGGYKNLVDTYIDFKSCRAPITVIGNNGTGKSNLIEALLEVFLGLYYNTPPKFDFRIHYEAHGKSIFVSNIEGNILIEVDGISWSRDRFKVRIRDVQNRPPFPALVFGYYSGTCRRIEQQLKRYNRSYSAKLRNQTEDFERNFIFSDIDQAKWVLLSLIAHGKYGLLSDISISGVRRLRITVKPPRSYLPDSEDVRYWDTKGAFREFFSILDNLAVDTSEKRIQGELGESILESRTYFFPLDDRHAHEQFEKIGVFLEKLGTTLYSMLQAFSTHQMLVSVNYELKRIDSETTFDFGELSEGEKQLVCVLGGLTMAQHRECLVLLDEPDTHLNPSWSWRYNKMLENSLDREQQNSSTVLVATHDPVLISGLSKEQVLIAHNRNGQLFYDNPHRDPKGQGIANILTGEFFGLPSSLDEHTQSLLDERLNLAYKSQRLSDNESSRLNEINRELKSLGLSISFRDPAYAEFEERKYRKEI